MPSISDSICEQKNSFLEFGGYIGHHFSHTSTRDSDLSFTFGCRTLFRRNVCAHGNIFQLFSSVESLHIFCYSPTHFDSFCVHIWWGLNAIHMYLRSYTVARWIMMPIF